MCDIGEHIGQPQAKIIALNFNCAAIFPDFPEYVAKKFELETGLLKQFFCRNRRGHNAEPCAILLVTVFVVLNWKLCHDTPLTVLGFKNKKGETTLPGQ
jgi:hypothetical protein